MYMIGHQNIGMEAAIMCPAGFMQQFHIKPVVIIRVEAHLAVIATLGDVLRYVRKVEADWPWHAGYSIIGNVQHATCTSVPWSVCAVILCQEIDTENVSGPFSGPFSRQLNPGRFVR